MWRARASSAAEVATRRSEEARRKQADERERKRLAAEVKMEAHRENAERVRRAKEHRAALTEAAIEQKSLRYEQRLKVAEEAKELRQAYAVERYKQEASMHQKLRAAAESKVLAELEWRRARAPQAGALTRAWDHAPPSRARSRDAGCAAAAAGRDERGWRD